jgi:hypothetical protein
LKSKNNLRVPKVFKDVCVHYHVKGFSGKGRLRKLFDVTIDDHVAVTFGLLCSFRINLDSHHKATIAFEPPSKVTRGTSDI